MHLPGWFLRNGDFYYRDRRRLSSSLERFEKHLGLLPVQPLTSGPPVIYSIIINKQSIISAQVFNGHIL